MKNENTVKRVVIQFVSAAWLIWYEGTNTPAFDKPILSGKDLVNVCNANRFYVVNADNLVPDLRSKLLFNSK